MIELTIVQLAKLLDEGTVTSVELTKKYIKRIANYDRKGPALNSILELNADAIHIAESLDLERKSKGSRGLLHGVPIIIKDNINTGDKMRTSAGSLALADLYAPNDAYIIRKLRESGAIVFAKSNMCEFAHFFANDIPDGYSSRGGHVINPYNKLLTPGGSSSGSAVAVAANFAMGSIGTETNGSIIVPSRNNFVVGIKPTVGLVSREGIIPISNSQDTAGPIARTVEDAAIMLDAIAGFDENDDATWKTTYFPETSYFEATKNSISGKRIGICTQRNELLSNEEQQVISDAVIKLKNLGAEIINVHLDFTPDDYFTVSIYEMKAGMNHYLSTVRGHTKMSTLSDIIAFNKDHPETCLKYGQKLLELVDATSGTLTEEVYLNTREKNLLSTRTLGLDKTFNVWNLDAIMTTEILSLCPVAGYPSITVPAGVNCEQPESLVFMGKPFSEGTLLSLAYNYEQSTTFRKPPAL
ncbi:amidase [Paenibacillus sp. GSMTC-2017]|nr:amidase [Paenibacillus sp. GSMTC-2017]